MTHPIVEIKIRGYHIDAFGVVNHAWFVRFFEEARWAYLDERPALRDGLRSAGVAHSVVSLHVEYQLPVRLGNLLRIKTRVKPGRPTEHYVRTRGRYFTGAGNGRNCPSHECFLSGPRGRGSRGEG